LSFVDRDFVYFLAVVFGLWMIVRRRYPWSIGVLLAASFVFYGYRQWWVLPILASYCLINWWIGIRLRLTSRPRLVLALGVGFNLLVLAFWKYTPLLVSTASSAAGLPEIRLVAIVPGSWAIPMGISFYAFTGIAYMVDVYRGAAVVERNPWRFGLFMSFFPQLVAGPILRAREFLADLQPGALPRRPLAITEGALLIGRGFFKKMVLADSIANAIDPFFANIGHASTAGVWALPYVYLYALQIYFDFSAYTDIARGLGLLFGFRWPENFNWPYLATSVRDFWSRWHMTLSRFLRDYLYIPLGGSRHGALRTGVALMLTMLLGGLWHGASWSFMLWGALHGIFLVVNHAWAQTAMRARLATMQGVRGWLWQATCIVLTFNAVCVAWCFFRLTDFRNSVTCLVQWVAFDPAKAFAGGSGDPALWTLLALYGAAAAGAHMIARGEGLATAVERLDSRPLASGLIWGSAFGALLLALLLAPRGPAPPFIYFQF
jgi:alginate O-acetyltransferase complex protein AlgI